MQTRHFTAKPRAKSARIFAFVRLMREKSPDGRRECGSRRSLGHDGETRFDSRTSRHPNTPTGLITSIYAEKHH
jgi:hypothetical protein